MTPDTPAMDEKGLPNRLWMSFADLGEFQPRHIRQWQSTPFEGGAEYVLRSSLKASQEAEVVKALEWRDIATQAEHVALGIASGAPTTEATWVLIDLIRSTWRDAQPSSEADGDAA